MLTLRLIDPNDYTVHESGQLIGRIRYARERVPGIWLWTIIVTIPDAEFGDAKTIDEPRSGLWRSKRSLESESQRRPP